MKWGFFTWRRKKNVADHYRKDYINEVLEVLENRNELSKIGIAFSFLLSSSVHIKMRTAKALRTCLSRMSYQQLVQIDKEFRINSSIEGNYNWKNESPRNLVLSDMSVDEKVTIFCLCTLHPNGYLREKAIQELASYSTGREILFFTLRCNDWVPEVREIAKEYMASRLTSKYANHIVQNLPVLFRLEDTRREDHNELMEKVVHFLSQEESLSYVERGTEYECRNTRYFCYRVMISSEK
jgi:hypothetical protein